MQKKTISLVVGARPNFMKASPLYESLQQDPQINLQLIHTGQHFDKKMSSVFFEELGLPKPTADLDIHGGSPISQVGRILLRLEEEISLQPPDMLVVFGDVNSTLAAAIVANKTGILLAHVEAGLRSFDRSMPEEHNRIVTDALSDLLFVPSEDAVINLEQENIPHERIHLVGNIMVDSLLRFVDAAGRLSSYQEFGVEAHNYVLVTLHRPSNVDEAEALLELMQTLSEISNDIPVVFPVHPRTRTMIESLTQLNLFDVGKILFSEPVGYLDFVNLMQNARLVITDSGGIQEETTVLGIPCLTVRENTERPVTVTQGTNQLVGTSREGILRGYQKVRGDNLGTSTKRIPPLWDGQTADRISQVILRYLSTNA